MAITLNGLALDDLLTSVREQHEEVGGRDGRSVEIAGLVLGETSVEAIETRLDAVLEAASAVDYSAALSIRSGRRLMVRRAAFRREVQRNTLVGSFTLRLEAREPFEEADAETEVPWSIEESPSVQTVTNTGTAFALPIIRIVAEGALVKPTLEDGERILQYEGIVNAGSVLVFDSIQARVTLDGENVTPYVWGEFLHIAPGESALTYSDDLASAHDAAATIAFRDRWW